MDLPGLVPESINCHACNAPVDTAGQPAFTQVECARCGAFSVVPLQFDNLLLLNVLGIGGMGTVYKAIDLQLNRYIAVKILRPKFAGDPQFIETFAREARTAAAVNHPNVAQVYAFAEYGGQYYLTMELLERGSLDDRITKLGKLPEADVLAIGAGIAAGLNAAHHRGLLHRDIKPGNILFNDDGVAKLVDFGLAGAQHEAAGPGAGVIWGTPYYIAPEKLRGQPEDFHSDMYSLGATLFHALAARPPFDGQTAEEVLAKQATTPAFNLKTYNPAVQDFTANVIGRTLAKEPAVRFATYDALIQELHQAEHLLHEKQAVPALVTATGERIPLLSIIATIAAVIATIVVVALLWLNRAKFGIETSTPPPAKPSSTINTTPAAVVPVEEVNFTDATPWSEAWTNAIAKLAQNDIQATLGECENLKQLTRSQPYHRQWAFLLEGVTLMAAGRATEASSSLQRANPGLPGKITTTNLAEPLAALLLDTLPASAVTNWPGWATDFSQLLRGLKHLAAGQFDAGRAALEQYRQLTPDPSQRWAYALQPLAQKLAGEISRIPATLAEIDRLQQAGKFDAALQAASTARDRTTFTAFKTQLDERASAILKAQQVAQQKLAEAQHSSAESETRQRAAAEQAQQQADAEVRQVQALETSLANYDFKPALTKVEELSTKLTTPAGKQALAQRRAVLRWLVELKKMLATDFARQPYEAGKIVTRGVRVDGKLTGATDTELTFTLQYGEMKILWRDLPPATIQQLGEFYAQDGKPADRARRYLATAVFAKQFNLKFAGDLKLAAQLDPALQSEITLIFGN